MSAPRLVHIGIHARGPSYPDPNAIEATVNANSLDWMRYSGWCYLLWTHTELSFLTNSLRLIPNMEPSNFFICAIDPHAPVEGYLPRWAWEWVLKYRNFAGKITIEPEKQSSLGGLSGLLGIGGIGDTEKTP